MTTRQAIVDAARGWIDTPYKSRHYPVRGHGCDCASQLLGVGIDAGVFPAGSRLPVYAADRHLHKSDEAYRAALVQAGFVEIPVAEAWLGDVLLYVMGGAQPASHAAIVVACTDRPSRHVHAYRSVGRVRESRIDSSWWQRARYAFRFPGVDEVRA